MLPFGEPQNPKDKQQHDDRGTDSPAARAPPFHVSLERLQFGPYLESTLKAGLTVFPDCFIDNPFKLRRNSRTQISDWNWILVEDCMMEHWRGIPSEGTLPGCDFIKNQTKLYQFETAEAERLQNQEFSLVRDW